MLTEQERQDIEAEIAHYEHKQAACIDALKIIQRYRGWVSDESLHDLAEFLELTPDELDNVATFYNLIFRKPVGRHVIFVCNSVSCWIMGYEGVRRHLSERLGIDLGQTTADNQFTLLPIQCLGTCDHAPALMVNDDLHRDLTLEKLDLLLQQYIRESEAGRLEGWKAG